MRGRRLRQGWLKTAIDWHFVLDGLPFVVWQYCRRLANIPVAGVAHMTKMSSLSHDGAPAVSQTRYSVIQIIETKMLPTRTVILPAALVVLFSGCASSPELSASGGKTREQARAELDQAWRDGWLPNKRSEYPPTEATRERNKKRYATKYPEDSPNEASLSRHAD